MNVKTVLEVIPSTDQIPLNAGVVVFLAAVPPPFQLDTDAHSPAEKAAVPARELTMSRYQ